MIINKLFCSIIMAFFILSSCSKEKNADSFGLKTSPLAGKKSARENIEENRKQIYEMYNESIVFIATRQKTRRRYNICKDKELLKIYGLHKNKSLRGLKGIGSGFIISKDGYVCTSSRLISGIDTIIVLHKNKQYNTRIIGADPGSDIALLKIETNVVFKPSYLNDRDVLYIGDAVFSMGSMLGHNNYINTGSINSVVKAGSGRERYLYQLDMQINGAGYGGPLLNTKGEVIGILQPVDRVPFAVSFSNALNVIKNLRRKSGHKRSYIGVSITEMSRSEAGERGLKSKYGALVTDIVQDGPAQQAGMKKGDVIIFVNGRKFKSFKQLWYIVGRTPVGRKIKMTVWRNRRYKNLFLDVTQEL